ncbi:MAG: hypothetical protein AAFU70_10225, partial [Planctomycetota bacterium]
VAALEAGFFAAAFLVTRAADAGFFFAAGFLVTFFEAAFFAIFLIGFFLDTGFERAAAFLAAFLAGLPRLELAFLDAAVVLDPAFFAILRSLLGLDPRCKRIPDVARRRVARMHAWVKDSPENPPVLVGVLCG